MANPSLKVVIWPAWPFARKGGVNPLRDNNRTTQWPRWQLPVIESQNCQNQTMLKETEEFMRIEWEKKKNRLNVFQNIVSWPKTLFKKYFVSETHSCVRRQIMLCQKDIFWQDIVVSGSEWKLMVGRLLKPLFASSSFGKPCPTAPKRRDKNVLQISRGTLMFA